MRSGSHTSPKLLALYLFASIALYVAGEYLLFPILGSRVTALRILPVVILAVRFGPWIGIAVAGTLLSWDHTFFLPARTADTHSSLYHTGWFGAFVEMATAIVVGRLSRLTPNQRQEEHCTGTRSVETRDSETHRPIPQGESPQDSAERLREIEQRFQIVARATKDVIYDWNIATNHIWWSENAVRILGYGHDQIIPTIEWWKEFVHPDDKERVSNALAAALQQGEFWEEEYRFRCRNGVYAFIHERGFILRNSAGSPVRMIGSLMDVTARKEAEEALRDREEFFRVILENSTDNVSVMRPDGISVYESPSSERVSGYTPAELLGRNSFELLHPEDRERVVSEFRRALMTGETTREIKYRFQHKDGSWRTLESVGRSILDENGDLLAIVNTRDVTDREQLEEQLRQSQKMEAIGNLAGGIAHDFNNLLTVITNYSYLAAQQLEVHSPIRADLDEITKASERAACLTRQLLAFSRKQVLKPATTNFNTIVERMHQMLSRLIGEDINLKLRFTPNLWNIAADIGQIEQVILNLVVNARDAMPTGGEITLETRNESIEVGDSESTELKSGKYAVLAVTDTGEGMDLQVQRRVFEPFFTTKPSGKGTGLGLSTVYGIIQQSGGRITVKSQVGQGTTFTVYLPRTTSAPPLPESHVPAQSPAHSSETILLVEDEQMLRKLVKQVLEKNAYKVLEAESAQAAIRVSEQHSGRIHLLLTDVVMPGESGRQLAEKLHPIRPDMRVLYMSGYTDDAVVRHGIQHDQVRLLQKPFAPADLLREVGQVLKTP